MSMEGTALNLTRLMAALVRISGGSSTVAMTMAAGIVALIISMFA